MDPKYFPAILRERYRDFYVNRAGLIVAYPPSADGIIPRPKEADELQRRYNAGPSNAGPSAPQNTQINGQQHEWSIPKNWPKDRLELSRFITRKGGVFSAYNPYGLIHESDERWYRNSPNTVQDRAMQRSLKKPFQQYQNTIPLPSPTTLQSGGVSEISSSGGLVNKWIQSSSQERRHMTSNSGALHSEQPQQSQPTAEQPCQVLITKNSKSTKLAVKGLILSGIIREGRGRNGEDEYIPVGEHGPAMIARAKEHPDNEDTDKVEVNLYSPSPMIRGTTNFKDGNSMEIHIDDNAVVVVSHAQPNWGDDDDNLMINGDVITVNIP